MDKKINNVLIKDKIKNGYDAYISYWIILWFLCYFFIDSVNIPNPKFSIILAMVFPLFFLFDPNINSEIKDYILTLSFISKGIPILLISERIDLLQDVINFIILLCVYSIYLYLVHETTIVEVYQKSILNHYSKSKKSQNEIESILELS
jgi:hypothetical protein